MKGSPKKSYGITPLNLSDLTVSTELIYSDFNFFDIYDRYYHTGVQKVYQATEAYVSCKYHQIL